MFNLENALKAANLRMREKNEEIASFSDEMRANLGILDPNSQEAKLDRAKRQEADILSQIESLKWVRGQLKQARLNQLFERLSELLAEQGKFVEASRIAVTDERREYYKKLAHAAAIPDETTCNCQPEKMFDAIKKREILVPNEMILAEVYSEHHGEMKNLVKCKVCGMLNIK